jgi:hypothetical protein
MQKGLELFSSLFDESPNLTVLHVNNNIDFLNPVIEDVVNNCEGKLDFKEFEGEPSLRLRAKARDYEYIILGDILDSCENKITLLQMYYKALENSANIIVLSKKSNNSTQEIKDLLDKTYFQAINDIDIFDDYIIVTGKKMHMWGNGL